MFPVQTWMSEPILSEPILPDIYSYCIMYKKNKRAFTYVLRCYVIFLSQRFSCSILLTFSWHTPFSNPTCWCDFVGILQYIPELNYPLHENRTLLWYPEPDLDEFLPLPFYSFCLDSEAKAWIGSPNCSTFIKNLNVFLLLYAPKHQMYINTVNPVNGVYGLCSSLREMLNII